MEAGLKHTKLLACVLGVLCLTIAAFAGKFTGELGLAVSGMVCAFIGGNSFITGKALSNGKGE